MVPYRFKCFESIGVTATGVNWKGDRLFQSVIFRKHRVGNMLLLIGDQSKPPKLESDLFCRDLVVL